MTVIDKFLRYVAVDTTSNEKSTSSPSTKIQFNLAKMLAGELRDMGAAQVMEDEYCNVYALIPGNCENQPVIGLIAHQDTVDDVPGCNIKTRRVAYQGGDILLNAEKNIVMKAEAFPELARHIGKTLIVTDGTTLLGADDKAGVAEIMACAQYLLAHPEIKHGDIKIAFTPDEEIGRGTEHFDVKGFGADFAYTVDGHWIDEMEFENFNAAKASITVHGFSIHPGSAKDRMVNAVKLAMELNSMLPPRQIPENTQGYEGFYHLTGLCGEVQQATISYIIRDHDAEKFEQKKAFLQHIVCFLNEKYGAGTFELCLEDQYRNMRTLLEKHPEVIDRAKNAISACGMTPCCVPIRGGTDGAELTYKGLPCPNLGTGGGNGHGVFEYAVIEDMEKMVEVLINIVKAE